MIVAGFELMRITSYPSSLQRLRGLRSGVVELGGLPDDDRAGADHEDAMQVSPSRH